MMKELAVVILDKANKGFEVKFLTNRFNDMIKVFIGGSEYCKIESSNFLELKYWISEME